MGNRAKSAVHQIGTAIVIASSAAVCIDSSNTPKTRKRRISAAANIAPITGKRLASTSASTEVPTLASGGARIPEIRANTSANGERPTQKGQGKTLGNGKRITEKRLMRKNIVGVPEKHKLAALIPPMNGNPYASNITAVVLPVARIRNLQQIISSQLAKVAAVIFQTSSLSVSSAILASGTRLSTTEPSQAYCAGFRGNYLIN